MIYLSSFRERIFNRPLQELPDNKIIITCLNANSVNVIQRDRLFLLSLQKSHIILPDGIAIVLALRFLVGTKLNKISGHELFYYEMEKLNKMNGRCFFLGSSEATNSLIKINLSKEYPNIITASYSPPYKQAFSPEDSQKMISEVNQFNPDVLLIGMTQPKQEKWAAAHFDELNAKHICCIGAVFDFYAGTVRRAPPWLISIGLEWLFRLVKEPTRLWKRYIFGNPKFILLIFWEKLRATALKKNNVSVPA